MTFSFSSGLEKTTSFPPRQDHSERWRTLHSRPPADYRLGAALLEEAGIAPNRATMHSEPGGWVFLVISNYELPVGFAPSVSDLLVKLPPGFPDAAPDCFGFIPRCAARTNCAEWPPRLSVCSVRLAAVFVALGSGCLEPGVTNSVTSYVALFPLSPNELRLSWTTRNGIKWHAFLDGLRSRSDVETAG